MTDDLCNIDSWGLPDQIVEVNILYLRGRHGSISCCPLRNVEMYIIDKLLRSVEPIFVISFNIIEI